MPMIANASQSFSTIVEYLIRSDYKKIQYFPTERAQFIGHEFLLIRSLLLKDYVTIFTGSALQPFYELFMRAIYPKLNHLYSFFFLCEELHLTVLLKFFTQQEVDNLTRNGIISCIDDRCICNYRIVPVDRLLITCSPPHEFDTVNYVHIGRDTITLWNLLKEECKKSVNDVLEIGCGAGFHSLWLSQFAQNVTATDISQRALEFTKVNARINGINNITTKISDVYSDVQGKFDLIISNPPYMFLPEEYSKRIYSNGGYLGTEILMKILLGLDDHLKDNGISFILAESYIKENDSNTLNEIIKDVFLGKPYTISLIQLRYQPLGNLVTFYKKHKISHSILYLIKIQKSSTCKLTHYPIQGLPRVMENLKMKLLSI